MDIKFCTACGAPCEAKTPPDDDNVRSVCTGCGQVHYANPKMVVGCIPELDGKVLMCRRDIEPRRGLWTLPAGYLENGESVQDGAARETIEETRAGVQIIAPYRLFNIAFVNQVYFMFRAALLSDDFGPTRESSEVCLMDESEIPWEEIAFKVIHQTLDHYFKDRKEQTFRFQVQDIKP